MTRGKKSARDYEGTISVAVPVPTELHKALKVHCAKTGETMKEVLYDVMLLGVKNILGCTEEV